MAHSISIDSLQGAQSAIAGTVTSQTILETSQALGGVREINASGVVVAAVSANVGSGSLRHIQSSSSGQTSYIWDGSAVPGVQTDGLGGIDLTEDGGSAFVLTVRSFNYPGQVPISIEFRVFDAGDPLAISTATVAITQAVSSGADPFTLVVPFSSFALSSGSVSGARFTQVGAISLTVNGSGSPSHSLELSSIRTDGNCTHIPVNGLVRDSCGVCNGNNSTCTLDCLGVPNGPAVPGSLCDTGLVGACSAGYFSGKSDEYCHCKADKEPSREICDQADNDCDGSVDEDFNVGAACVAGVGACQKPGTLICASNGTSMCSFPPRPPSVEVCDNIDNDCDGQVDEDFQAGTICSAGIGACKRTGVNVCTTLGSAACSVTAGVPSAEICDGIDNNCNGQIDEGSPTTGPLVGPCGVCGVSGTSCLDCKGVPNGSARIDVCNVCGGDGKSCLDCKGVPNGAAKVDVCNVCGGDGTSCQVVDCKGVRNGTTKVDVCNVCGGNGTSCLDCKGTPNGKATVDICNVCDGDGRSCLDCKGTPNGTARVDECNVCGGDGSSCRDCKGTPNGTAKVDACNVCGGDGRSCLDCKGTPNGNAKVDACNVCGGDGTSCLDCQGIANGSARQDECGVCGGNGSTCACTAVDLSPVLGALDSGAKEQQIIVQRAAAILRAIPAAKRDAAFIKKSLESAQKIQINSWKISWTLPVESVTCAGASSLCVTSSNLPILSAYRSNNVALRDLALALMNRVKGYRRGTLTASDRRIVSAAGSQFRANLSLSQTVPEQQFSCTEGK